MISFFRELPFQIQIRGELSLVQFAAGFSKAVDPLSGMTVNLKYVNSWLESLPSQCFHQDFTSPFEVLVAVRAYLQPLAKEQGALVTQIQLRRENQDLLQQSPDGKVCLQRSWWMTERTSRRRVQMIATFSVGTEEEMEQCQFQPPTDEKGFVPEKLFQLFPVRPIFIEVRDPLTGLSTVQES